MKLNDDNFLRPFPQIFPPRAERAAYSCDYTISFHIKNQTTSYDKEDTIFTIWYVCINQPEANYASDGQIVFLL